MTRSHRRFPVVALFLGVLALELAFGLWMSAQDFRWLDAISRAVNALVVLHGSDPHLAAIGFVWMPLPSTVELLWMPAYPIWPQVISTGFASVLTTSLGAAATAALLLMTARRLGLSDRHGLVFALLVAANPMLLLYGASGMSEGVAAPALTGSICALTLFWHSGRRRYVAYAALALALAFASLYEAVPWGVALAIVLAAGLIWGPEAPRAPHGRRRAVQALALVLVLPATYVGLLWIAANAAIMDDPLYFATSSYSNTAQSDAANADGSWAAFRVEGHIVEVLLYVGERTAPFLLPLAALLVVRALDRRLWNLKTASLLLLTVSVPLGLIAPLLYLGATFGWLRLFMYPLMVAAGWGLYEVASSRRRHRAAAVLAAGWVLTAPAVLATMAHPGLGQEEHLVVRGLLSGKTGEQVRYLDPIAEARPVARDLERGPLRDREWVALDLAAGYSVAGQVEPHHLDRLLLSPDRRFDRAIRAPAKHGVRYLLVASPDSVPQDAIVREHPDLWHGRDPRFELVRSFAGRLFEWKLFKVRGPVAPPSALEHARAGAQP